MADAEITTLKVAAEKSAEFSAAIFALIARLETAERNYNALKQAFDENPNAAWVRMHKAEARAERLEKALREIAERADVDRGAKWCREHARAALAAERGEGGER